MRDATDPPMRAQPRLRLHITSDCSQAIADHASHSFPEECCGALLGTESPEGTREIVRLFHFENAESSNRSRSYLVAPGQLLQAAKAARDNQLELLGIYHSHPAHVAVPSEFDRRYAQPFWSYLIVTGARSDSEFIRSWRLDADEGEFVEDVLEIGAAESAEPLHARS